jgi:hypothetical protein
VPDNVTRTLWSDCWKRTVNGCDAWFVCVSIRGCQAESIPELADDLRERFPSLIMMEDLAPFNHDFSIATTISPSGRQLVS